MDKKSPTPSKSALYQFAQLGQVSAGFFHDAANIVAALKLETEMLQKQSQQVRLPPAVIASSKRLHTIVTSLEQLISVARAPLTSAEREEFEVSALVDEIVAVLRPFAQRAQIKLEVISPAEPVVVTLNKVALFQALLNCITNAIESYVASNKQFSFKVVEINITQDAGVLKIRIQDWGIGMTQHQLAKLYQPFHSSKPPVNGHGVGLYLTKQQIQTVLGGVLSCHSMPNEGSTFEVTIPLPHSGKRN